MFIECISKDFLNIARDEKMTICMNCKEKIVFESVNSSVKKYKRKKK